MAKRNMTGGVTGWVAVGMILCGTGVAHAVQTTTSPSKKDGQPLPVPGPTKPAEPISPAPTTPPSTPPAPAPAAPPATPPTPPTVPQKPAPSSPTKVVPSQPSDVSGRGGLVDLRPKFQVGREWKLKLSNNAENTTQLMTTPGVPSTPSNPRGNPHDKPEPPSVSKVDQDFVLVFKPIAVTEDGGATVEVFFESIAMKVASDSGNDAFDSNKPAPTRKPTGDPMKDIAETPLLEQTLRPLVGERLTLTVDRDGEVTKVEGGDKFAALFGGAGGAGGAGGSLPGNPGGGAKSLFGGIFSVGRSRPQARVGDRWTTQDVLDLAMAGRITMNTSYVLNSAKGGRANMTIAGQLQSAGRNPTPDAPFVIRECSHSGDVEWNTEDGFIQSMNSGQKLSIDMMVGGMAGKSTSVQKTTVRRIP